MVCILDKNYFRYSGRILEKDGAPCLGFTNSKVEFYVKGTGSNTVVTASISTNPADKIDQARLKVFIDDSEKSSELLVLKDETADFTLASFQDQYIHKITVIKITEASKSYAKLNDISVIEGEVLPLPKDEDKRLKIEFIGDSITCGYGVYGEPDAEYTLEDEDGTVSYAYLAAKDINLDARYFSVSGFGVVIQWDGNPEGNIPKVYPYTNYFMDQNEKYNFKEFIPDLFVINLGTNDSSHLVKEEIKQGFISNYIGLLKFLKSYAPDSKILCICGTMCTNSFEFIEKAVALAKEEGLVGLYTMEQPFHDIENEGMAGGHPSLLTHQKNAKQLTEKLKEILD